MTPYISPVVQFCIFNNNLCSSRSIQRKYTTGQPDQKDLSENLAATQGLAHMITECQRLFQVRIKYATIYFCSQRNNT